MLVVAVVPRDRLSERGSGGDDRLDLEARVQGESVEGDAIHGIDHRADRIATACTILGSAHLNGIDPLAYLTDVIAKLQVGWPMSRIDELLPDVWSKAAIAPN